MASNPDEEVNGAFELLPQFSYCKKEKKKKEKAFEEKNSLKNVIFLSRMNSIKKTLY